MTIKLVKLTKAEAELAKEGYKIVRSPSEAKKRKPGLSLAHRRAIGRSVRATMAKKKAGLS